MTLAPVILFVYKRPALTRRVLQALAENELAQDSKLYIFCDGPRENDTAENLDKITETRRIAREKKWCGTVEVFEEQSNKGLARSVVDGVSSVIERYGKAIILEDDILATRFFLQYMNDALDVYENERGVISVGACNFFTSPEDTPETFFIKVPDCWGWATWKDRWKLFETDGRKLYDGLKKQGLLDDFNLSGIYDFEKMLTDQIDGKNNSWAIRWQAVAYLNRALSLYPRFSVVRNLGFDEEATHGATNDAFRVKTVAERPINVTKMAIKENDVVNKQMLDTYSRLKTPSKKSWMSSIKSGLSRLTR